MTKICNFPYPIYNLNKNLISYYCCSWHGCPKHNIWRVFVDGLIDDDEKVVSSKKPTQFKTTVQKSYPINGQIGQNHALLYLWPKQLKNHTLNWGSTYLYKAVHPQKCFSFPLEIFFHHLFCFLTLIDLQYTTLFTPEFQPPIAYSPCMMLDLKNSFFFLKGPGGVSEQVGGGGGWLCECRVLYLQIDQSFDQLQSFFILFKKKYFIMCCHVLFLQLILLSAA